VNTGLKVSWAILIFLYFWPILTKVLIYEAVILRITAMKFCFCGNHTFHWLLHFFPSFENQFFLIVKNKLTSVFCASVLLLMINFFKILSKFVVDQLACGSWIYNTLTMLWRNLSLSLIRGQTHKKTDVNLLIRSVLVTLRTFQIRKWLRGGRWWLIQYHSTIVASHYGVFEHLRLKMAGVD